MARTTATRTKLGPVSRVERAQYRALIADDIEWRRPTSVTAREVCVLLAVDQNVFRAPRTSDNATAAQAFVVALDYLIRVGDQGRDGAQLL
jgi:hypothetical protein